jgi:hypothetical protein
LTPYITLAITLLSSSFRHWYAIYRHYFDIAIDTLIIAILHLILRYGQALFHYAITPLASLATD